MKVGNIVDGLAVIDVKRVRQMHPVRQYKEVVDYLDKGYKIDHTSAKLIGLVHEVDMYKLEGVTSEAKVESTGFKEELEPKNPNEDVGEAKVEQKRQTRSKKSTTESKEDSTESN